MVMPLAAAVLLCVAWSIYWFVASSIAKETLVGERAGLARRGISLTCSSEIWGGFPFRFEFSCANPSVTRLDAPLFKSANLKAIAQAYYPWHVLVLLDGPTGISHGYGETFTVNHQRALASLLFRNTAGPEFSMELPNAKIDSLFDAKSIQIHTRPEGGGTQGLAISMTGVHHQRPGRPHLDIDSVDLLGTLQLDRQLQVHSIVLKRKEITWQGTGEVRLDPQTRIAGTLHTETNDLDGLLAILEPHLVMTDQQRLAFKTVMGLLGQQAKADVIAKDGELYIGPFKIAELLPLT